MSVTRYQGQKLEAKNAVYELCAQLVILAIAITLTAINISLMWQWFVVPLGAPKIGYAHAVGLGILLSYATHDVDVDKKLTKSQQFGKMVIKQFGVLIAYFAYLAM